MGNMYAFTLKNPIPNGNDSGIGVVIWDSRGTIIKMYFGTAIKDLTKRVNESWATLVALKRTLL